jgi:hypothetical protein
MDFVQFFILFVTIVSFMWALKNDNKEFKKDLKEFREKWADESKDFHGRLVALEQERNRILEEAFKKSVFKDCLSTQQQQ